MKYKIEKQGKIIVTKVDITKLYKGVDVLNICTEQKHCEFILGSGSDCGREFLSFYFYEEGDESGDVTIVYIDWKGSPLTAIFEERYGLSLIVVDWKVFENKKPKILEKGL